MSPDRQLCPKYTQPRTLFISVVLLPLLLTVGCIEHRVTVKPPLPADPPPTGEDRATTVLIAGSRFRNEPTQPENFASPLPLDIPVSVYRRESDGSLARGEFRVITPLPWWQRFPADAVVDLSPIHATVDADGMPPLIPVIPFNRDQFIRQAERDGYARTATPAKSKP
jgi:hypothetical protein